MTRKSDKSGKSAAGKPKLAAARQTLKDLSAGDRGAKGGIQTNSTRVCRPLGVRPRTA